MHSLHPILCPSFNFFLYSSSLLHHMICILGFVSDIFLLLYQIVVDSIMSWINQPTTVYLSVWLDCWWSSHSQVGYLPCLCFTRAALLPYDHDRDKQCQGTRCSWFGVLAVCAGGIQASVGNDPGTNWSKVSCFYCNFSLTCACTSMCLRHNFYKWFGQHIFVRKCIIIKI